MNLLHAASDKKKRLKVELTIPHDQGIIRAFKAYYRRGVVKKMEKL